jgi:hypothetical protein
VYFKFIALPVDDPTNSASSFEMVEGFEDGTSIKKEEVDGMLDIIDSEISKMSMTVFYHLVKRSFV